MRKKDEMEQRVANKATRISYFVTVMALIILGAIQSFSNSHQRNPFSLIAILSITMLITLERYYLSRINEDKSFNKMIALTIGLAAVILGIGWFISR